MTQDTNQGTGQSNQAVPPVTAPIVDAGVPQVNYGFVEDKPQGEQLDFGLQAGTAKLTKFEFNPNGGSEGSPQDCLDIVIDINGKTMSGRVFPVTRAFDNGNEVTDPRHPEFQKALSLVNGNIVHILKAFTDEAAIRTALSAPITNFEQFARTCQALLPNNFATMPLDVFLQYEWEIREDNDRTWLRLPKNVKHGAWICAHIPPVDGDWTDTITGGRLVYKDGANNEHPFTRGKWFMESTFAKLQKQEGLETMNTNTPPGAVGPTSVPGNTNW